MPISYMIDAGRQLVVTRATGIVVDADVETAQRSLRADPSFDPAYRHLSDLRRATDVAIASSGMRHIAGASVFHRDSPLAIIAETTAQFGMASIFATLSEERGHVARVFRDLPAALTWLAER